MMRLYGRPESTCVYSLSWHDDGRAVVTYKNRKGDISGVYSYSGVMYEHAVAVLGGHFPARKPGQTRSVGRAVRELIQTRPHQRIDG